MKRLIILLMAALILTACGSNEETPQAAEPEVAVEKKSELTNASALYFMELMTHRYIKTADHENGSFEQKSEIQAGIKQADLALEEIEAYDDDLQIVEDLEALAEEVKSVLNDMLDGDLEGIEDKNYSVGTLISNIANEYLDGELPPTLKARMALSN